jgi:hypothetical protein
LTTSEFEKILQDYGLNSYPRYFGNPQQIRVRDFQHLQYLIAKYEGKAPLYISHNMHDFDQVLYTHMFFDFDGKGLENGLERAQEEVTRLYDHFYDYDKRITFSGQGFHLIVKFEPVYTSAHNIDPKIKAYQKGLAKELNLTTLDLKCAQSTRLMRIPLTRYVWKSGNTYRTEKRYAIPITREILDEPISIIMRRSETLEYEVERYRIKRVKWKDIPEVKTEYLSSAAHDADIDFTAMDDEVFTNYLRLILDDEDLIARITKTHTKHNDNLITAIKVKEFGLTMESTVSFFAKLSLVANWDNRNLSVQRQQIAQIYHADYKVRV